MFSSTSKPLIPLLRLFTNNPITALTYATGDSHAKMKESFVIFISGNFFVKTDFSSKKKKKPPGTCKKLKERKLKLIFHFLFLKLFLLNRHSLLRSKGKLTNPSTQPRVSQK